VLGSFAVAVLLVGLWPKPLTDLMETSVQQLVSTLMMSKA